MILATVILAATTTIAPNGNDVDMIPPDATAKELVENCRTMIPANVELSGRIIMRNRKGIPLEEYDYVLRRIDGKTDLNLDKEALEKTDVTWSDITLDYLWWDDFDFDGEREGESVHGQKCVVIVMKKGDRRVRVWVDRKTGALMQAEEFKEDKPIRRLWGTRIKKFGERWMANVLEVENVGSGHRTKITVEALK